MRIKEETNLKRTEELRTELIKRYGTNSLIIFFEELSKINSPIEYQKKLERLLNRKQCE